MDEQFDADVSQAIAAAVASGATAEEVAARLATLLEICTH